MFHRPSPAALAAFLLLVGLAVSSDALSDTTQANICRVGLGLGQAEARITLFGRVMQGNIPVAQIGFIATNLASASASVSAVEAMIEEPFRTSRAQSGIGAIPTVVWWIPGK